MRKLTWIATIGILFISACSSNVKDKNNNAADSSMATSDTSQAMAATKDATATAPSTSTNTTAVDNGNQFATAAANIALGQVNTAKMAEAKTANLRVKNLATSIDNDYTQAGNTLASIAKSKNIALPVMPDIGVRRAENEMARKSGKDFDIAYMNTLLDGNKKAMHLFEDAAKNCANQDLKSFAAKNLTILKAHLDSIKAIQNSLK